MMNVITLNEAGFDRACDSLAIKIAGYGEFTALIGVRTGGAIVAEKIFTYLQNQGRYLEYYEVGASRYATAAKKSYGIKNLFKYIPMFLLDWLRIIEHYIVNLGMRFSGSVERSVCLDHGLVDYLTGPDVGRLIIIDDAIDSGATVKALIDEIKLINPGLEMKVAVLVVTQEKPLVSPDVCLYRNVLIRFPWSSDFKR